MWTIIGLLVLSIVIAFIYIFLVKTFPKVMVYTMITLSLLLLAVVALIGIFNSNWGIAIPVVFILLIYLCVLFCMRRKIPIGIVLIKVAGCFIQDRPSIFLTPILKIFMTAIVSVYWFYSFITIIKKGTDQEDQGEDATVPHVFIGIWIFIYLFYTFLFYYIMVYTIAVSCAFWYYDIRDKNAILTSYRWICGSHLGSLTFASITIAVVTFIRMIVGSKRSKNPVMALCLCLLSCILRLI
eukprot:GHVR01087999.1.p1 GENE.GHVR01087999.1~~GHVR01087999.1.p1  ORF type:complete len:240 (-),score=-15.43 GHVR01087999.1:243-962(-)